jgi:hypothetical protein
MTKSRHCATFACFRQTRVEWRRVLVDLFWHGDLFAFVGAMWPADG